MGDNAGRLSPEKIYYVRSSVVMNDGRTSKVPFSKHYCSVTSELYMSGISF